METNNNLLLIIIPLSFISVFLYSAKALCVPRDSTQDAFSPFQPASQPLSLSPAALTRTKLQPKLAQSPPPVSSPTPQSSTPPPKQAPSTPKTTSSSQQAAPAPSLPSGTSPSSAMDPALKAICAKTDYPELCLTSITPFAKGATDPVSVLQMEIQACTQSAQTAISKTNSMLKDPSTSSDLANNLDTCKESYDDALDNLQRAMDAVPIRDTGTINIMLSAALTDFGTCGDGFTDAKDANSPLAQMDEALSNLASNCLAISSLIN